MKRLVIRRALIALSVLAVAVAILWLPTIRSKWLFALGSVPAFDSGFRARMLANSAAAGGPTEVERACELALNDPERAFSLFFLEYLWDKNCSHAHLVLQSWLKDETIAWPQDQRQIRRCDLAAHYFRMWVGERRWDTAKALSDLETRNQFRTHVASYLEDHGLPPNS